MLPTTVESTTFTSPATDAPPAPTFTLPAICTVPSTVKLRKLLSIFSTPPDTVKLLSIAIFPASAIKSIAPPAALIPPTATAPPFASDPRIVVVPLLFVTVPSISTFFAHTVVVPFVFVISPDTLTVPLASVNDDTVNSAPTPELDNEATFTTFPFNTVFALFDTAPTTLKVFAATNFVIPAFP